MESGEYDSSNKTDRYNILVLPTFDEYFCWFLKWPVLAKAKGGRRVKRGIGCTCTCTLMVYFQSFSRDLLAYVYIPVIQKQLDIFRKCVWNNHRTRKQKAKKLPAGVPEHIYTIFRNSMVENDVALT